MVTVNQNGSNTSTTHAPTIQPSSRKWSAVWRPTSGGFQVSTGSPLRLRATRSFTTTAPSHGAEPRYGRRVGVRRPIGTSTGHPQDQMSHGALYRRPLARLYGRADGGPHSVAPVGDSQREKRSMVGVMLIEGRFVELRD